MNYFAKPRGLKKLMTYDGVKYSTLLIDFFNEKEELIDSFNILINETIDFNLFQSK